MEEIGKILLQALKPEFDRTEPPVLEVLAPLWPKVVGKALAKECRPTAFRGGVLTLTAEDEGWDETLENMKEEIRRNVNQFLGKPLVTQLRVRRAGNASGSGWSWGRGQETPGLWPGQEAVMASGSPQWAKWSRAKPSPPKHRKVV
jgi:hypothetical protein